MVDEGTISININSLREILQELLEGNKVQNSSAKVMKFLIQDLLDFA